MRRTVPSPMPCGPLRPAVRRGLVLATLLALAACGGGRDGASQTAAQVNKAEVTVHQINHVLQQQRGLRPEQADAAGRQILERLIDQELAVQRADELKLDREPRVVQALEAARREVLARAYAEKVGEAAAPPTPQDIQRYYDEHPELFAQRRVYNLQEITIEAPPAQAAELRARLAAAKNVNEFVEYLKSSGLRFAGNQAVRAAEQLPLASLKTIAAMRDGQALMSPTATGVLVLVLAGSREQAVGPEQARPAIEQFLLNERKRKLVDDDRGALRAAATIRYVGSFAAPAASAPAAASDPAASAAPALPAAPAASTALDPAAISKGMGGK